MTDRVMSEHDQRVIHSSEDPNWRTPPECFLALAKEFNFGWDLAADAQSTLLREDSSGLSARYLGPGSSFGENALSVSWHKLPYPICFLNPPFSRVLASAYRTGRIKSRSLNAWIPHPVSEVMAQVYEIESWVRKCWEESQKGATIVGLIPFAPQTDWYREYVYGHSLVQLAPDVQYENIGWNGHAAREERRLSHRISFLRADGTKAANAGVNTAVIIWKPNTGFVGPWMPWQSYWSYR